MPISIAERLANISVEISKVTAADAKTRIDQDNGLLIDVREPQEAANAPVACATNIPRGILEMKMLALESDDNRPIYLHCASGVRATLAAEQLLNMGYKNVSVITCDINNIANSLG